MESKKYIYNGHEFKEGQLVKLNERAFSSLNRNSLFKIGIIEKILDYDNKAKFVVVIKGVRAAWDPYWFEPPINSIAASTLYGANNE